MGHHREDDEPSEGEAHQKEEGPGLVEHHVHNDQLVEGGRRQHHDVVDGGVPDARGVVVDDATHPRPVEGLPGLAEDVGRGQGGVGPVGVGVEQDAVEEPLSAGVRVELAQELAVAGQGQVERLLDPHVDLVRLDEHGVDADGSAAARSVLHLARVHARVVQLQVPYHQRALVQDHPGRIELHRLLVVAPSGKIKFVKTKCLNVQRKKKGIRRMNVAVNQLYLSNRLLQTMKQMTVDK